MTARYKRKCATCQHERKMHVNQELQCLAFLSTGAEPFFGIYSVGSPSFRMCECKTFVEPKRGT